MGEQLLLAPKPAPMSSIIEGILSSPWMVRPVRFDDLVHAVRIKRPDADLCEIDKAARVYERGEPGAYTYELPAREEPA